MITAPRRHKHHSSHATRPSEVAVTVNIDAEFNVMAVNPSIECFSRDLIPEYCHGLEFSVVYTLPLFWVESLPGRSNTCLPPLTLPMHAEEINPTFLTLDIHFGLWLPKALTLIQFRSYKMSKVLQIVRILQCVGLLRILNFPLLWDMFLDWLARGIPHRGGSSVSSTIRGQNSTPSSSLDNSRLADKTERMTPTSSATKKRSWNSPTTMPGTSSRSTPPPWETSQTHTAHQVVCSPASGIASTPTLLSGLEKLPTPSRNPEAHTIITNPL